MSSSSSYSSSDNNPLEVLGVYDVFLSFRGEDTRSGFTSHLYDALVREGIKTFFDDKLVRGKTISAELMKAIQGSRSSVIILSEHYPFSTWCLKELCKIVECMDTSGLIVLPIFFHVSPSYVRKLIGSYRTAFKKHENNPELDIEEVEAWRDALKRVGHISGWNIEETDVEADFIKDIIADLSSKLDIRARPSGSQGGASINHDIMSKMFLEQLVNEGSQDVHVHNALGKIIIDSNNNPEQFLTTDQHYDSRVVGKYCEERDHPTLAFVAYCRGQCDDELVNVTNKNALFKLQARYVVERMDGELWEKVLDPKNEYRRQLIDQVVSTALRECKSPDQVSATIKAFNRFDCFDGPEIAKVAVNAQLYEEAFALYKKFNLNVQAVNVLLDNIGSIDRAVEFAFHVKEDAVWSQVKLVNPANASLVVGKLLDVECPEDFIKCYISSLHSQLPVEQLVNECEKRNRLSLLTEFLKQLVSDGIQDVHVHNALGKIIIDNNDNPEHFLMTNQHYDSHVLGKYCEKQQNPALAVVAYRRGQCDEKLINVTNTNSLFKLQASYVVERMDSELWKNVLGYKNEYRSKLIDEVISNALPESKSFDQVSAAIKAFSDALLPHNLIELLENIVLQNSVFSGNSELQGMLIQNAIKEDPTRVMDYINRLDNFDGPAFGLLTQKAKLYEEAFAIYKKFNLNVDAVNVLLDKIQSIDQAVEFGYRVKEDAVWNQVRKAQHAARDANVDHHHHLDHPVLATIHSHNSDNNPQKMVAEHDVFLSFRGEDMRTSGFTSHVCDALVREGIKTIFDDKNLVGGRKAISTGLRKVIHGSRSSVVVLSENYAFSRWCLTELCMIVECMDTSGLIVVPIFYHVNPSDVKRLTGSYGAAFKRHQKNTKLDSDEVESWRNVLKRVGNLAGWTLNEMDVEAKFIKDFIPKISSLLDIRKASTHEPARRSSLRDDTSKEKNVINPTIGKGNKEFDDVDSGSEALTSLKTHLQSPSGPSNTFAAVFPESKISSWFRKQSSEPSIGIQVKRKWERRNKLKGIALCVCFRPYRSNTFSCEMVGENNHSTLLFKTDPVPPCRESRTSNSFNIWIVYLPLHIIPQELQFYMTLGYSTLSFHNGSIPHKSWFQQCGIRIIYERDISYQSTFNESPKDLRKILDDRCQTPSNITTSFQNSDISNPNLMRKESPHEPARQSRLPDDTSKEEKVINPTKALEILKSHFQDRSGPTNSLYVVVFESKISSWFTSSKQSTSMQVKRNWSDSNLMGLAICVCFRPYPSNILYCKMRSENSNIQIGGHRCHPNCEKSNSFRIWMIYLSRDDFPKQLLRNVSGNIEISFHNELLDDGSCFGQCGSHSIYRKDLRELNQINESPNVRNIEAQFIQNFIQDVPQIVHSTSKEKNVMTTTIAKAKSFLSNPHSSKILYSSDDEDHWNEEFNDLNSGSKAMEILKTHFQDRSGPTKSFDVVVSESKIPSWFTFPEQSRTVQLKRNWRDSNFMGLAVCVCFRPYQSNTLSCQMRLEKCHIQIGSHRCHPKCGKSNGFRIWMIYLSRDDLPKQLFKNVSATIEISFHNELLDHRSCFGQCGIRSVYRKDMRELTQIN